MAKKSAINVEKILQKNPGINEKLLREAQEISKATPKSKHAGRGYRLAKPFKRMVAG